MKSAVHKDDAVALLAARLEALRVAYERFMLGVERVEPVAVRHAFVTDMRRMLARPPNNTAQNFRLQAIKARLLTFEALWDRHLAAREASHGPRQRGAAVRVSEKLKAPGLSPDKQATPLQQLYAAFVAAHTEAPTLKAPTFAAFEALVRKQTTSIKERTGWQDVGLRVTLNSGRPALQAFNAAAKP